MQSDDEVFDGSGVPRGSDLIGLRRDATDIIVAVLDGSMELWPLDPQVGNFSLRRRTKSDRGKVPKQKMCPYSAAKS
jgi:hypothetical protein